MTPNAAILNEGTRLRISHIENEKRQIVTRLRSLVVSDQLKNLDFSKKDERCFVEYYPGVFVRDTTSELGKELGRTDLHIMCKNDIVIDPHEHVHQSQMIMVREGKLRDMDDENNGPYYKNEVIFIRKNRIHRLKYFAGSQYLITFMPQLNEEEN